MIDDSALRTVNLNVMPCLRVLDLHNIPFACHLPFLLREPI